MARALERVGYQVRPFTSAEEALGPVAQRGPGGRGGVRRADAGHGRVRAAATGSCGAPQPAVPPGHRLRRSRGRGGRAPGGGRRLPDQAGQDAGAAPAGPAAPRPPGAVGREPAPAAAAGQVVRLRGDRRPLPGHGGAPRAAAGGGADPVDGARRRASPGTGKELVANALHQNSPRVERALRGGQLRRHPGRDPRVGAVRARAGGVHRRAPAAHRPHRVGLGRHPVPRRDLRALARPPGQAAAGARGAGGGPGRRQRADSGGLPPGRGDQPQPRASGRRRAGSARTSTTASRW